MSCDRCGTCCGKFGMWVESPHPLMQRFLVLLNDRAVKAGCCPFCIDNICWLEKYLGRDAKPEVCRDYLCERAK
jgi:hypothetical protein